MTEDKRRISGEGFLARVSATFFFSGYLPKAPGTWASGITTLILFFIWPGEWYIQLAAIAAVYLFGILVSGKAENYLGHDSPHIVIDEVAGQMAALFMAPPKFLPFILGFIFFRLFDILKPPPCRAWESWRRGWGVMADDLAAGFYAACSAQLILALLNKWGIGYI